MEIRRLEEQGMTRNVLVQRNTKETKITMSLNLDGTGKASLNTCLLYTSPSPRDATLSRMPSSA